MEDQAFYSLKNSLIRLKKERDEITSDLLKDKQNMIQIETHMRKIKTELDFRVNELKEKENNLNDYDKVIKESESTLQRVDFFILFFSLLFFLKSCLKKYFFFKYLQLVETSNKLAQALDSESCFLREKISKNK